MGESSKFEVGAPCVWKGQGLAMIESIQDEGGEEIVRLRLVGSGKTVGIARADADRAIRRVLDRDTAAALWAELQKAAEADTRSWEERYFDYARTLAKGTPREQVLRLRKMYGSPFEPSIGERKLIDQYEEVLFTELGHVLGRKTEEMRAEMRSRHPVFSASARKRPPEPKRAEPKPEGPQIAGLDLLGSFRVEGGLVIADPAHLSSRSDPRSRASYRVAALPGTWYGYTVEDEDTGRTAVLIAVHASKLDAKRLGEDALGALRKRANVVSEIRVEGGQAAILDQAVRDEERFEDELSFRTRYGTVLGRGCTSESGLGDGTYPVSVVMEGEQAVYVQVDFR